MKRYERPPGDFGPSVTRAIVRVGRGRGFVIQHREEVGLFEGKRIG